MRLLTAGTFFSSELQARPQSSVWSVTIFIKIFWKLQLTRQLWQERVSSEYLIFKEALNELGTSVECLETEAIQKLEIDPVQII